MGYTFNRFVKTRFFKTRFLKTVVILCGLAGMICTAPMGVHADDTPLSKSEKVMWANVAGGAAITAWGIANWDYFRTAPSKGSEGWFSSHTESGGADKCAHFYFSYTLSHILASLYESWDYPRDGAARLGALSSFGLMSYMELGDSFSEYGFSYEDFLMNMAGAAAGYLLYKHPELSEKIDFRIEYTPDFSQSDPITDYENMKFLMALKFGGFPAARKSPARFFELHLGYYTRGFPNDPARERNLYLGLGISLPAVFSYFSMDRAATVFKYVQVPHTSINKDLD